MISGSQNSMGRGGKSPNNGRMRLHPHRSISMENRGQKRIPKLQTTGINQPKGVPLHLQGLRTMQPQAAAPTKPPPQKRGGGMTSYEQFVFESPGKNGGGFTYLTSPLPPPAPRSLNSSAQQMTRENPLDLNNDYSMTTYGGGGFGGTFSVGVGAKSRHTAIYQEKRGANTPSLGGAGGTNAEGGNSRSQKSIEEGGAGGGVPGAPGIQGTHSHCPSLPNNKRIQYWGGDQNREHNNSQNNNQNPRDPGDPGDPQNKKNKQNIQNPPTTTPTTNIIHPQDKHQRKGFSSSSPRKERRIGDSSWSGGSPSNYMAPLPTMPNIHAQSILSNPPKDSKEDSNNHSNLQRLPSPPPISKGSHYSPRLSRLSTAPITALDIIVIHVFDDSRKISQDFRCHKHILISEMKYFEKYLTDIKSFDDIDISVHCDIKIFAWLMKYILAKQKNTTSSTENGASSGNLGNTGFNLVPLEITANSSSAQKIGGGSAVIPHNEPIPTLNQKNVISILISADFLKMKGLAQECIDYFLNNIWGIMSQAIDLSSLNSSILRNISKRLTVLTLEEFPENQHKLKNKLFMKKLEQLLEADTNLLKRCNYCNELFTQAQIESLKCPKAKIFIDFHGNIISKHVGDNNWSLNKFINYLHSNCKMSWRDIYWKIWSYTIEFKCEKCEQYFRGSHIFHCAYHPQKPIFQHSSNRGIFKCCNLRTFRFHTKTQKKAGCCGQRHRVKLDNSEQTDRYTLIERMSDILGEPFTGGNGPNTTPNIVEINSTEPKTGESVPNKVQSSTPEQWINDLLLTYIKQTQAKGGGIGTYEEEDDEDETENEYKLSQLSSMMNINALKQVEHQELKYHQRKYIKNNKKAKARQKQEELKSMGDTFIETTTAAEKGRTTPKNIHASPRHCKSELHSHGHQSPRHHLLSNASPSPTNRTEKASKFRPPKPQSEDAQLPLIALITEPPPSKSKFLSKLNSIDIMNTPDILLPYTQSVASTSGSSEFNINNQEVVDLVVGGIDNIDNMDKGLKTTTAAGKKKKIKLQISDVPRWKIRAAHLQHLRHADMDSMNVISKMLKKKRINDKKLFLETK